MNLRVPKEVSTAEHAAEAIAALTRARRALDTLWIDCRALSLPQSHVDRMVHNIVFEIVSAQDELEDVLEHHRKGAVEGAQPADPQAMNVNEWKGQSSHD